MTAVKTTSVDHPRTTSVQMTEAELQSLENILRMNCAMLPLQEKLRAAITLFLLPPPLSRVEAMTLALKHCPGLAVADEGAQDQIVDALIAVSSRGQP